MTTNTKNAVQPTLPVRTVRNNPRERRIRDREYEEKPVAEKNIDHDRYHDDFKHYREPTVGRTISVKG